MSATRTQVYLTAEQRRLIDEVVARDCVTLAEVVRAALDSYLHTADADPAAALEATFGAEKEVRALSRDEWARG